jgi:hypothetical protein
MVIQGLGFGPELTAKQAIDRALDFMGGLEAVSPWTRPFVASGTIANHSFMPIAEDLSDFESVVMTALADYNDVKYLNENDPDDSRISLNSKCYYGYQMSFSKLGLRTTLDDRVDVALKTQGLGSIERGRFPLLNEVTTISVQSYRRGEVNELWGSQEVVMNLIDHIIDFADPIHCCVCGDIQNLKIMKADQGNFKLGWLTYTKNRHFMNVLAADKRAAPHKRGVLLKLGEGVETIEDDSAICEILEIQAKLRSAGLTDWREI